MALPISAGEIFDVVKFASDLWYSCKAAKGEFEQIGQEVLFMRTTIEMVHIDCEDPQSIINLVDNKEKTVRKQLRVLIGNCQRALKAVEKLLKHYERMSALERMKWAFSGHAEVSSLESNLSSFATQLDSYVQKLEVKGQGLINKNVGLVNKDVKAVIGRLGRLEDLIEKYNGDENAAVKEILHERQSYSASQRHRTRSATVMMDYAKEVSKTKEEKQRPKTPDPPRGRPKDQGSSTLDIPKLEKRTVSADTKPTVSAKNLTPHTTGPDYTLECWLIQRKSGHALFVTFELSEKESQSRGQWKLRQMARQFNSSCEHDKLDGNHDLVQWVLKDRKKKEHNPRFTWHPHAAKIEQKGEVLLGMGVEEQAMVIIKRQLTPEAQKIADDKAAAKAKEIAKKAKAKEDAAKKKAAEAALKKEKSMQAARIKELEEAMRVLKMRRLDKDTGKSAEKAGSSDKPEKDQAKQKTQPKHTKKELKDPISDVQAKIKDALDNVKKPNSGNSHSSDKDAKGDSSKNKAIDKNAKSKAPQAGEPDKKSPPKAKNSDSIQDEANGAGTSKSKKTEKTKAEESDEKSHQKAKKPDSLQDKANDAATSKSKKTAKTKAEGSNKKLEQKANKPDTTEDGANDVTTSKSKTTEKTADIQMLLNENAKLKAALKAKGLQEALEEAADTVQTDSPKSKGSKERPKETDQAKAKKQDDSDK